MKFKRIVLLSSMVLGIPLLSVGQITNTGHDFWKGGTVAGNNNYKYSNQEICVICHAAHNNSTTQKPLWNRLETQQVFNVYGTNSSGYNLHFTPGQPDGSSKLCLSCHDGLSAVNMYGVGGVMGLQDLNSPGAPSTKTTGYGAGQDLRKVHPISFVYDGALVAANPTLHDTSVITALGGSIGTTLLDKQGKVQCTSCHEIHGTGLYRLQRINNAGSALCLSCHNK